MNALKKLHAALFVGAAALFAAAPAANATVVTTLLSTPLNITNSIDGIYLNIVTGVSGASASVVSGWDINPYNNGAGLTFYGAASPSGVMTSMTSGGPTGTLAAALSLAVGSVVSSAGTFNQFQTVGTNFVGTTGVQYVGLRFQNEATATQNYGYLAVSTTAGTGFPATVLGWAYENTGAAITVAALSPVPEAGTFAMLGLGLAAIGGLTAVKRRKAA